MNRWLFELIVQGFLRRLSILNLWFVQSFSVLHLCNVFMYLYYIIYVYICACIYTHTYIHDINIFFFRMNSLFSVMIS